MSAPEVARWVGRPAGEAEACGLVMMVRASTGCPECRERHVVDIRYVLLAQEPGTWSLAGVQNKAPARWGWSYRCTICQASGACPAPADRLRVMAAPVMACGHAGVTGHYPQEGEHALTCAGCCLVCQAVKDGGTW